MTTFCLVHGSWHAPIPLVARHRPVRRLVYLAALVPKPGMSMSEQFAVEEGILVSEGGRDLDDHHRSFWIDRKAAIEAMYSDCTLEDAEWAWSRLRPQARSAQDERFPLDRLPEVPSGSASSRSRSLAGTRRSSRVRRSSPGR